MTQLLSDLTTAKAQLADLAIDQSLSAHVDRILGYVSGYKNTVVPTVVAKKGAAVWSDEDALAKLTQIFDTSNLIKEWCNAVHDAGSGVSSILLGIHNQMMGSEVHGRAAIDAAFDRALFTVYGVDSLTKLFDLPLARRTSNAPAFVERMNSFMAYVMNIERTGLGCLMNADLLDPEFRNLEQVIREQKRDLLSNIYAQFAKAQRVTSTIGLVDAKIVHEVQADCSV
jgi:hypothetical protein